MIIKDFKAKLKNKAKEFISQNIILTNLGSLNKSSQPKIALCHKTIQYLSNSIQVHNHANTIHSTLLLSCLIRAGGNVSCFDINHSRIKNDNFFDYIIGFGNSWRALIKKNPNAKKILWLVEPVPKRLLQNENKKISQHNDSYKISDFLQSRINMYYNENDILISDYIFHFGDSHNKDLTEYKDNSKLKCIRPCGQEIQKELFPKLGSKDLLWFGGNGGWYRKGLDYVLKAKDKKDKYKIHVCGPRKKNLPPCLLNNDAIFHNIVDTNSQEYAKIISACRFTILLSYGEGLPISILTTMKSGLIPIISEHCGSRFNGLAVVLKDNELSTKGLRSRLEDLNKIDDNTLHSWSIKCKEYAYKNYNQDIYVNDIMTSMREIGME